MDKYALAGLARLQMSAGGAEDAMSAAARFAAQALAQSAPRPQPVARSLAAVIVFSRDMSRTSGIRRLPDLLRLVPGVQVSVARGNIHTATVRGCPRFVRAACGRGSTDVRSMNPASGLVEWPGAPVPRFRTSRSRQDRSPRDGARPACSPGGDRCGDLRLSLAIVVGGICGERTLGRAEHARRLHRIWRFSLV